MSQHFASGANTSYTKKLTIDEIKYNIKKYNLAQTVYNEDLFGTVQNDTIIIVVQVYITAYAFKKVV